MIKANRALKANLLTAWIFAEKNTSPGDIKRCIRTQRYKYIRNFDDGPELSLPTDIEQSLTRRDMGDEHLKNDKEDVSCDVSLERISNLLSLFLLKRQDVSAMLGKTICVKYQTQEDRHG